jgi:hypothetical protein
VLREGCDHVSRPGGLFIANKMHYVAFIRDSESRCSKEGQEFCNAVRIGDTPHRNNYKQHDIPRSTSLDPQRHQAAPGYASVVAHECVVSVCGVFIGCCVCMCMYMCLCVCIYGVCTVHTHKKNTQGGVESYRRYLTTTFYHSQSPC